jgi:TetR/AcrR family transcriptional regulator, mexCD-oprJ operon repressor
MSPEPSPRQTLQGRVAAAILDGAAQVFALQGEQASMNDVAVAAGVARATVYRYFPNRDALLDELGRSALNEVDARLRSARIEGVTPEEGIARAARALVDVGDLFVLLVRQRPRSDPERFERSLSRPLGRLFERGQRGGDLRDDITSARLTEALFGLIVGVLTSTPVLGKDDMTATITGLFLDGARARGPRPA